jgi:hypothetical protein
VVVIEILESYFDHHPHVCGWIVAPLVLAQAHLYWQTSTIRRVVRMRSWDGLFMEGKRKSKQKPPTLKP